jgi:hypothetical protein
MSKVMQFIIAHCEVCPHVDEHESEQNPFICKYSANFSTGRERRAGYKLINKDELPIPGWCKLPDKEEK